MKKHIAVIAVCILVLMVSACSDVYRETVISDIRDYKAIWTLPERRASEVSVLFPSAVEAEQVTAFYCKHSTYKWLGTGWQVVLSVGYDEAAFSAEQARLRQICDDSVLYGLSAYFDHPAYATVWNWNACFEYAIVNEDDRTVSYVYLQLIQKDDLILDETLIPKQYEMELPNVEEYSVYS